MIKIIGFGLLMFISSVFILKLGLPNEYDDNDRQFALKLGLVLLEIVGFIGLFVTGFDLLFDIDKAYENSKINVSYKTDAGEIVTCEKCWLSVYDRRDDLYKLTDKEGNQVLINAKDIVSK